MQRLWDETLLPHPTKTPHQRAGADKRQTVHAAVRRGGHSHSWPGVRPLALGPLVLFPLTVLGFSDAVRAWTRTVTMREGLDSILADCMAACGV